MKPEEIEKLLLRRPFVPFRIHFSNSQFVDVVHPEWVYLTKNHIEVGHPVHEGSILMQKTNYYGYIHIVRLEMLEAQTTQSM